MTMGRKQLAGWALVVLAGALSTGIVAVEVAHLIQGASPESSEGLPVVGFQPVDED